MMVWEEGLTRPSYGQNSADRWPPFTVFHLPPSSEPSFVFNFHKLDILLPTPKINPHKHEKLWLFLILTIQFCPINVDTHELYPSLSVLEGSPFQQQGRLMNPKLRKSPSTDGEFQKMLWGAGGHSSLHVQTCRSAFEPLRLAERAVRVPIMKTGVVF